MSGRGDAAAVLLAAGSATRMGRRPKLLLELDGVPLVRRAALALAGAGVREIVAVTGTHAERVEPALAGLPVRLVRNPSPEDGLVASQRLGLAALEGDAGAIVIALADQPLVEAADIRALLSAWTQRRASAEALVPHHAGARGNPVIVSAQVRAAVLAGAPGFGCRQWMDAHPGRVDAFLSDSDHVVVDIDTDEDRLRFERETGRTLRWPLP